MDGLEENKMENNSFSVPNAPNGEQPAQEAPQNFTNPEPFLPPEPKKSNTPVVIVLFIVLVVLVVGGGLGYWYLSGINQNQEEQSLVDKTEVVMTDEEKVNYACSPDQVPGFIDEINEKLSSGTMTANDVPARYSEIYTLAKEQNPNNLIVCIINLLPEIEQILIDGNFKEAELNLLTSVDYDILDDGTFTLTDYTQHYFYKRIIELAQSLNKPEIVEKYQPLYDQTKAAWDEIEQGKVTELENSNTGTGS